MSIPLDRLYHHIERVAKEVYNDNVIIYRFYPHGSKNVNDLDILRNYSWLDHFILPHIYCNDQEPLDYEYYEQHQFQDEILFKKVLLENNIPSSWCNLRRKGNIYDKCLLLHSEQRSENLKKYNNSEFISVYYWSHAIISRDWFRYANEVSQKKNVEKRFLVYNRAWSGTREYRLGFADRLITQGLVDHTLMRVSPIDSILDKHYDLHTFEHPHWRPHNVIEKHFPLCEAESHYSADFDQEDYESTDIEIVLETLFDDLRLHLTEKTLRPIAMGQPFILAGTYGSLKYLRDYGFKTFGDCWDESYDMMSDSIERMNKITEVMSDIVSMTKIRRDEMLVKAQAIADYNKQHFFSDKFQEHVISELYNNLQTGLNELENTNTCRAWFDRRRELSCIPEIRDVLTNGGIDSKTSQDHGYFESTNHRQNILQVVAKARKYYLRSLSKD